MDSIVRLEQLGYRFILSGSKVRYVYRGAGPEPAEGRSLLENLRRHRGAAMAYFHQRAGRQPLHFRGLEAEATALLRRMDTEEPLAWCRRWAEVMTKYDVPCGGTTSWAEWLAEVEEDLVFASQHAGAMNP